ncbi:unnamed protein product [Arctia plantaginis]|uniref:Tetratricopeptide repeat protein 37 n=1 Tax=Arctia plantaginis TaxID=874455 RepID=A0A8S0YYN7_ARCPL|nr:unnamed protein product [Arctia plantaginis]
MLNLQIEEEKAVDILSKLGLLGCTLKNRECLHILIKYIEKKLNNNVAKVAEKYFVQLLTIEVPLHEPDIPSVLKILSNIYIEDPSDSLEMLQCKVIIQKSNFSAAVEEIIKSPFFPTNVILRDWLCKQLCTKYVEKMSFSGFDIEKYIDTISEGIMNSKYPSILRSMICYDKGLYLEAYKQCVPLVNYHEAEVMEATFIIKCTIMLKKWSVAQKLATNFLTKVKDQEFAHTLKKFLLLSLTNQHKWNQAISITKDIPIDIMETHDLANLAECYIEANESADHIMKHLETSEYSKQLQALLLLKHNRYEEVIDLLQDSTDHSLHVLYLGKAYWELKQYDKCLIYLLRAAKLNPDHADTFLYLGYFYRDFKSDEGKAKKCFEKASALNPIDCTIAKNLSETYIKLQQMDSDFELLNTLKTNAPTIEPWVNFRLGLHYLRKREWENAILNFRNVIKSNHNDTVTFECLADAYYARGSFTSALRAYKKVMTLDPDKAEHCLTRIGYIHSLLTQYEEGIATFELVFKIDPYSVLALKGVAETWMRIAKKKADAKIYGTARDCAQHAVDHILKALFKKKQFLCFWKLLADSLMFITKLPNQYAYVYMPPLTKDSGNMESSKKDKFEIFPQAIACYSHIAKQKQQVTSYDLASAYLALFYETQKIVNCNLSFNLTIKCIKEKPTSWRHWNLLGKTCLVIKKYDIAQHCFIKALTVTRKWSVAKIWCNLGSLYLKLQLYKLANYCFWRGQSILPSYPQSWIGQGLIAEVIREEEAMDLFRHASRLGYHPESALGYADWVCRTLKNNKYKESSEFKYEIEGLYAIPYSIDLVEWYCNFESDNACAYNILGILQERHGLLRSAMKSYEQAFKYAEDDKKDTVLLNIGRILVRMEKYEEAIKIYKAITEASFNSTAGLALALFKKGCYEESYSVYDTALQWLSNEESEKADLLVAMAGIVYMFKGLDDAKTLLFHSIQVAQKKPTPHSLFAICSLGLMHSDQSLSKLALGELRKYEKDNKYGFDIGFLKSYLSVCEDNMDHAIKLLSDCLHDHPSNAMLWFCMAQYCLRIRNTKAKVASCCAQKALCTAHYGEYDCNAGKILASASIAEHMAGDYVKSLLLAKGGLHMFPNQAEIWAALLFSLLSNSLWIEKKNWLLGAAAHMRRHLNVPRQLSRWIILIEKKLNK